MENYGTMDKTMVPWTKLWYYTDNFGTSIYEGKNILQKLRNFDFSMEKTMEIYENN